MSRFPVISTKEEDLVRRMRAVGLSERTLEEKFVRSQGPGGQNVNKTSTCVFLRDPVSGLQVKCQQSRSLALNRFTARRILVEKLEAIQLGRKSAERQAREKIRRQKRRRSRRAKDKMLEAKRRQGEKKTLRRSPSSEGGGG